MTEWHNKTHLGDCRALMKQMAADGVKVNCIVTSPPYWQLRDYGVDGQIGLEPTLQEWVDTMVDVFRCARDVLAEDGTLWLNLGDSYSSTPSFGRGGGSTLQGRKQGAENGSTANRSGSGLKPKNLIGQPWRVALALQNDGWYLRSDIIWAKPNPMPESAQDRPTKSHEYIFLMSKAETYYYDNEAVREPRSSVGGRSVNGWASGDTKHNSVAHARDKGDRKMFRGNGKYANNNSFSPSKKENTINGNRDVPGDTRNLRTVWSIPTEGFADAHFATFPQALVRRCVLAGSRPGDVILDPFMGSGTTAQVASSLGRQFIGCELNEDYIAMHAKRDSQMGMAL